MIDSKFYPKSFLFVRLFDVYHNGLHYLFQLPMTFGRKTKKRKKHMKQRKENIQRDGNLCRSRYFFVLNWNLKKSNLICCDTSLFFFLLIPETSGVKWAIIYNVITRCRVVQEGGGEEISVCIGTQKKNVRCVSLFSRFVIKRRSRIPDCMH